MTRTKTSATTRAFLSIEEVAALLGEHRSTCYRSIERGDFPVPVVRINGRLRVSRQAVERLIAGQPATFSSSGQAEPGGEREIAPHSGAEVERIPVLVVTGLRIRRTDAQALPGEAS